MLLVPTDELHMISFHSLTKGIRHNIWNDFQICNRFSGIMSESGFEDSTFPVTIRYALFPFKSFVFSSVYLSVCRPLYASGVPVASLLFYPTLMCMDIVLYSTFELEKYTDQKFEQASICKLLLNGDSFHCVNVDFDNALKCIPAWKCLEIIHTVNSSDVN